MVYPNPFLLHEVHVTNFKSSLYCTADSSCTDGSIRLTGESSEDEGRVEVCGGGLWGTVCGGGRWDYNDAAVVCRQLGYPESSSKTSEYCC